MRSMISMVSETRGHKSLCELSISVLESSSDGLRKMSAASPFHSVSTVTYGGTRPLACRTATRRAKQSNAKPNQRRGSGHMSAPRGQHNMQGDDGGADNLSCRHPLEWEGGVGLDDY